MNGLETAAGKKTVTTVEQLVAVTQDAGVRQILVRGHLVDAPSVLLAPGQTLEGEGEGTTIAFAKDTDGLQLSSDNRIQNIHLDASADRRAIFNDTTVNGLGRIELRRISTTGRVQIIARDKVYSGHVDVDGLDIVAADARGANERPQGYGVHVLQGAFTLWNQQPDGNVLITADLIGLSAGRDGAPVRGGGIFVSGAGDKGGRLIVRRLETDAVYSDGGIAPGTADQISGGVFTLHGAPIVRNSIKSAKFEVVAVRIRTSALTKRPS
jgi:hypothetical protein